MLTAALLSGCSQPAGPSPAASASPPSEQSPIPAPSPPAQAATQATPPGSGGEPFAASRSFVADLSPRQAWFICDSLGFNQIFVIGLPDESRRIEVLAYDRNTPGSRPRGRRSGASASPGAGQVYWPLTTGAGTEAGNLHAFNPGALSVPGDATTPTFTSARIGGADASCRWVARTRLMGFSARRTFLVTQAPDGGLEYRTFDARDAGTAKPVAADGAQRSTTPSLDIKGGEETPGGFVFSNKGYAYTVTAGPTGGRVDITRGATAIGSEPLIAWTIAPKL